MFAIKQQPTRGMSREHLSTIVRFYLKCQQKYQYLLTSFSMHSMGVYGGMQTKLHIVFMYLHQYFRKTPYEGARKRSCFRQLGLLLSKSWPTIGETWQVEIELPVHRHFAPNAFYCKAKVVRVGPENRSKQEIAFRIDHMTAAALRSKAIQHLTPVSGMVM